MLHVTRKFAFFARIEVKLNTTTLVMAGRKKGDGLGRLGGRQKGTENKTTQSMKALVAEFANDKFDAYKKAWNELEDKDKVSSFNSILKFVIPTSRDEAVDDKDRQSIDALFSILFDKKNKMQYLTFRNN